MNPKLYDHGNHHFTAELFGQIFAGTQAECERWLISKGFVPPAPTPPDESLILAADAETLEVDPTLLANWTKFINYADDSFDEPQ